MKKHLFSKNAAAFSYLSLIQVKKFVQPKFLGDIKNNLVEKAGQTEQG